MSKVVKMEVECGMPNCNKVFNSTEEYEKHYKEEHLLYWGHRGYPTIRVWK